MRKELLAPVSSALAAGLALLLLRRGVVLGPDSWAYWEASVSLRERGAYAYFGGQRVAAFPPLFSCWLLLVQAVLGVSARSLALGQAVLAACAAWQWVRLYEETAGPERARAADAAAVLSVSAALAVSSQTLLSESLWLALLPVALRAARRPIVLAVAVTALLLTRNVTLAFLPALLVHAVLREPMGTRLRRAAATVPALLLPVGAWLAVLRALGQSDAHALGSGASGLGAYLAQTAVGLAEALGPARFHAGALLLAASCAVTAAFCLRRTDAAVRARALAAAGLLALVGQAALFAATYVAEPIRGRFVVFAALVAALTVACAAAPKERRLARAALAVGGLIAAVALLRVGVKARLAGVEQPAVAWRTTVSSSYWNGPPRPSGALVLVAPPTYPWLTRPAGGTAP